MALKNFPSQNNFFFKNKIFFTFWTNRPGNFKNTKQSFFLHDFFSNLFWAKTYNYLNIFTFKDPIINLAVSCPASSVTCDQAFTCELKMIENYFGAVSISYNVSFTLVDLSNSYNLSVKANLYPYSKFKFIYMHFFLLINL